jgi:hypothetical protein
MMLIMKNIVLNLGANSPFIQVLMEGVVALPHSSHFYRIEILIILYNISLTTADKAEYTVQAVQVYSLRSERR